MRYKLLALESGTIDPTISVNISSILVLRLPYKGQAPYSLIHQSIYSQGQLNALEKFNLVVIGASHLL